MRIMLVITLFFGAISSAFAFDLIPATPLDPDGYGDIVEFGAQEDHDLYPGPGNVVGDVRSSIATSSTDQGLSPFVQSIREEAGSTPTPPGKTAPP